VSVHERAYQLAKTMQETDEYKQYLEAKEKLRQDEHHTHMLQEFRRRQLELQIAEMSGEDTELQAEQLERMYQMLCLNPIVNEFLTAEYRLARVITDVQKILGEALDLWVDMDVMKNNIN